MSRQLTKEMTEDMTELICERYLPRVFEYVSYWVNETWAAEKLTLKALHTALAGHKGRPEQEEAFLITACSIARNGIQGHIRANGCKPVLPNLTAREKEVVSLKLGAELSSRNISLILGLSETTVNEVLHQSLCKLNECQESWPT